VSSVGGTEDDLMCSAVFCEAEAAEGWGVPVVLALPGAGMLAGVARMAAEHRTTYQDAYLDAMTGVYGFVRLPATPKALNLAFDRETIARLGELGAPPDPGRWPGHPHTMEIPCPEGWRAV
jgi:hypothetical protein